MTGKIRILSALLLAAALTAPGVTRAAERIILRNGGALDGNIRTQNRQVIVIDTKAGRQTIPKSEVVRVMFGMPDPEDEEKKKREAEAAAKIARERDEQKRREGQEAAARQEEEMRVVAARAEEKERQMKDAAAAEKARQESAGKKTEPEAKTADRSANPEKTAAKAEEEKRREETAALLRKREEDTARENKEKTEVAKRSMEQPKEEKKPADKIEEKKPADKVEEKPARDTKPEGSGISAGRAALYSMILPGLGQMNSHRSFTGGLYLTLFAGALYGAYNENRMYMVSRKDYEEYNNPYNSSTLLLSIVSPGATTSTSLTTDDPLTSSYLTSSEYETKRKDVEQHFQARNNLAYGALAIYLWSVLDAFLFTSSSATAQTAPAQQQNVRFFAAPMQIQRVSARDQGVTVGMSFQL